MENQKKFKYINIWDLNRDQSSEAKMDVTFYLGLAIDLNEDAAALGALGPQVLGALGFQGIHNIIDSLEADVMDVLRDTSGAKGYYFEYDFDNDYLAIYGVREETDKEYEIRQKNVGKEKERQRKIKATKAERARLAKEQALEEERALYEELKKKFGE